MTQVRCNNQGTAGWLWLAYSAVWLSFYGDFKFKFIARLLACAYKTETKSEGRMEARVQSNFESCTHTKQNQKGCKHKKKERRTDRPTHKIKQDKIKNRLNVRPIIGVMRV